MVLQGSFYKWWEPFRAMRYLKRTFQFFGLVLDPWCLRETSQTYPALCVNRMAFTYGFFFFDLQRDALVRNSLCVPSGLHPTAHGKVNSRPCVYYSNPYYEL